ncbi:hypothetical protein SAMN05216548_104249 [Faunimonas pinastri]|uniref:SIMPL domain-containing protein n=1 Tax=Faunimonas pinastri TaxID=1855383 RepID=A0A1H9FYA2_9HYPH|nr:SIMPL domain-containing protein [Faunimonas pinastri]SEQ42885.1 hypothetical protein SAMN05216548_104249 [Faunimonas pinastri]
MLSTRMLRSVAGGCLLIAAVSAPGFAAAQGPATKMAASQRHISVTGNGTVNARPDMATMTIGVIQEAETAGEAAQANAAAMGKVIDGLKQAGIAEADLQTSGYSVSPNYSEAKDNQKPRLVGYTVSNNVSVKLRDITKVGTTLDAATSLGANSISGPEFGLTDPKPLQDQTRQAAVADAIAKAKLYAAAAGVDLGEVVSIEEQGPERAFPVSPMPMRADMARKTPVEAGEVSFSSSVSVTFALR